MISALRKLAPVVAKFGVVGLVAFTVDVGLFVILTTPSLLGFGVAPVAAKALSTAVASVIAFAGNYRWVFSGTDARVSRLTVQRFVLTNVAALAYTTFPVVLATDFFHVTNLIAINLIANVLGVALGSALRLVSYRVWVFPPPTLTRAHAAGSQGTLSASHC